MIHGRCRGSRKQQGSSVSSYECIHGCNVDKPSWYGSKFLILGLTACGQDEHRLKVEPITVAWKHTIIFWNEKGLLVPGVRSLVKILGTLHFLCRRCRISVDFRGVWRRKRRGRGTTAKHSYALRYAAEIKRLRGWVWNGQIEL